MSFDLTLRNIPAAVFARLQQSALTNHRTIDREAIVWLESVAPPQQSPQDDLVALVQEAHTKLKFGELTDEDINAFKHEGRP